MRLHQERGCLTSPSLNLVEKRRWATLLGPYKSNKQTQPQQPEASSNESKKVPDRWKLSNLKARAFLVGLVPRPTLQDYKTITLQPFSPITTTERLGTLTQSPLVKLPGTVSQSARSRPLPSTAANPTNAASRSQQVSPK